MNRQHSSDTSEIVVGISKDKPKQDNASTNNDCDCPEMLSESENQERCAATTVATDQGETVLSTTSHSMMSTKNTKETGTTLSETFSTSSYELKRKTSSLFMTSSWESRQPSEDASFTSDHGHKDIAPPEGLTEAPKVRVTVVGSTTFEDNRVLPSNSTESWDETTAWGASLLDAPEYSSESDGDDGDDELGEPDSFENIDDDSVFSNVDGLPKFARNRRPQSRRDSRWPSRSYSSRQESIDSFEEPEPQTNRKKAVLANLVVSFLNPILK